MIGTQKHTIHYPEISPVEVHRIKLVKKTLEGSTDETLLETTSG